jgi:hypothetical protein
MNERSLYTIVRIRYSDMKSPPFDELASQVSQKIEKDGLVPLGPPFIAKAGQGAAHFCQAMILKR